MRPWCAQSWVIVELHDRIRTILTPLPTEHQLATVEPYQLKRDENWPANVTLVGPTATCWAASRGRLTWNDIIGYSPHGGHYVVNAKMATIRARWTHARGGRGPRPTDNAKELAAITEAPPTATVKRALHTLKMTDWLKPLKDFARASEASSLTDTHAARATTAARYARNRTNRSLLTMKLLNAQVCASHASGYSK